MDAADTPLFLYRRLRCVKAGSSLLPISKRKEVNGMKKTINEKALQQEAAFWDAMKKAAAAHPGKSCRK